jgi:hypothetical protein
MANVRRHMGIKYNLSTCTDNDLRNLEMHIGSSPGSWCKKAVTL